MISLDLPPSSNSLNSALLRAFGSNGGALGVLECPRAVLLFTFVFAFTVVRLVLSFGSGGVIFPGAFSSGGVLSELMVSLSIAFEEEASAMSVVRLSLASMVAVLLLQMVEVRLSKRARNKATASE